MSWGLVSAEADVIGHLVCGGPVSSDPVEKNAGLLGGLSLPITDLNNSGESLQN